VHIKDKGDNGLLLENQDPSMTPFQILQNLTSSSGLLTVSNSNAIYGSDLLSFPDDQLDDDPPLYSHTLIPQKVALLPSFLSFHLCLLFLFLLAFAIDFY
jgi:hypothetical protein